MSAFASWFKQPFSSDMSAIDWFYFFGLLIVISVMWSFILVHIREAA